MLRQKQYKRVNSNLWKEYWQDKNCDDEFLKAKYHEIEPLVKKYTDKNGIILEGGCGLGRWVTYLHKEGYNILGIDSCKDIVKKLNYKFPNLSVSYGDIKNLNFKNEYFSTYISDGVMEHLEEGIDKPLKEAYRVLKPEGILIITVPYLNLLRLFKELIHKSNSKKIRKDYEFYQYAYSKKEIIKKLNENGFEILNVKKYGAYRGLKELFLLGHMASNLEKKIGKNKEKKNKKLKFVLRRIMPMFRLLNWFSAHMFVVIAKKKKRF